MSNIKLQTLYIHDIIFLIIYIHDTMNITQVWQIPLFVILVGPVPVWKSLIRTSDQHLDFVCSWLWATYKEERDKYISASSTLHCYVQVLYFSSG